MLPELILLMVGVACAAVALLAVSLAKAAKAGDIPLRGAHPGHEPGRRNIAPSGQLRAQMAQEAPWLDLGVHPRPTRDSARRAKSSGPAAAPTHPRSGEAVRPAVSTSEERAWPTLGIDDAAEMLGVSPDVLLAWEGRYGFPKSCQWTTDRGLTYSRREVLALSEALERDLSLSSAIASARMDTTRQRVTARKAHLGRHPVGGDE
jgi:hypothetical protein